jgi:hypothetical protein
MNKRRFFSLLLASTALCMAIGLPASDINADYTSRSENGNYSAWKELWKLPAPGNGVIIFKAKTSNDIHVAISDAAMTKDPMYEIVIGGWGNTKSAIRRQSQGELMEETDKAIRKTEAPQDYWICLDGTKKTVSLGYGNIAGKDKILEWKDPNYLNGARFVAFSSWDAVVSYSGIKFIPVSAK